MRIFLLLLHFFRICGEAVGLEGRFGRGWVSTFRLAVRLNVRQVEDLLEVSGHVRFLLSVALQERMLQQLPVIRSLQVVLL